MHFKINYRKIPAISSCENLISSGVGLLALRPSFEKEKKKSSCLTVLKNSLFIRTLTFFQKYPFNHQPKKGMLTETSTMAPIPVPCECRVPLLLHRYISQLFILN